MKKWAKKLFSTFAATLMLISSQGMQGIHANSNTTLQVTSSQFMEIDKANSNQINYYTNSTKTTKTGSVQVKLQNSFDALTPVVLENGTGAVYDMGNNNLANLSVELNPNGETNYRAPDEYTFGANSMPLSTTRFDVSIAGGTMGVLDFDFVQNGGGGGEQGGGGMPGPMVSFPLIAYFSGINSGVEMNNEGHIVIPDAWTSGTVTFKVKIFTKDDGTVEPYEGQQSGGTAGEETVAIEGIANGEEIHNTVTAIPSGPPDEFGDRAPAESITITEGFSDYGKLQLHIVRAAESNLEVNQLLTVVNKNLINIQADAPISLSQSFGTVGVNQAIITKDELKNVKIFFGNNETRLVVSGSTVDKITAVEGGKNVGLNNDDGSATVTLPGLSTETTTPVQVTILKRDGTSITRRVNIVRTAVQLQHNYGGGDNTVYAGYVVNKGYLYNNQAHNDAVFNAYLQVILYKDNAVAGYKQIKIDDEALVNGLQNNESGSLELYSENQIAVYGKASGDLIDGVNKVSVFLTNGPVDFNGTTLPSVEFGIGSGVTCEWEALS